MAYVSVEETDLFKKHLAKTGKTVRIVRVVEIRYKLTPATKNDKKMIAEWSAWVSNGVILLLSISCTSLRLHILAYVRHLE